MVGILRGFGWSRVFLGAATTLALAALFYLLVSVTIDPLLYAIIVGGGKSLTSAAGELLNLVDTFSFLFHLTAVLLALMVGSLVASGSNRLHLGLRSAASAVLVFICVSVLLVVAVILWLQQLVSGPAEAYTRYENLQLLLFWSATGFIVLLPLVLLAGYIGGRFGRTLPRRIAGR